MDMYAPASSWIAAHALALELPLVTNNVREFSRVPDVRAGLFRFSGLPDNFR